jgi:hypothetical protein
MEGANPTAGGGYSDFEPPDGCAALRALGRVLPVPMRISSESLVVSGKAPWFFGGFTGD